MASLQNHATENEAVFNQAHVKCNSKSGFKCTYKTYIASLDLNKLAIEKALGKASSPSTKNLAITTHATSFPNNKRSSFSSTSSIVDLLGIANAAVFKNKLLIDPGTMEEVFTLGYQPFS